MEHDEWLARRFEEHRPRLRAVASRMLGSQGEAEEAVQEAWLRLRGSEPEEVDNLGGWLTTVVSRLCLDTLRSRRSRGDALARIAPPAEHEAGHEAEPGGELALAEAVGPALLVVLESLAPAERVAFVLHDLFDVPFEDIAPLVQRAPEATRQLASRARRRIRGATPPAETTARSHAVVAAFLKASREGDLDALLALLTPDAEMVADDLAVRTAAANRWGASTLPPAVHGAKEVAETFRGRARGTIPATIDGAPGAVWSPGGSVRAAFLFRLSGTKVAAIELVMQPERLSRLVVRAEPA